MSCGRSRRSGMTLLELLVVLVVLGVVLSVVTLAVGPQAEAGPADVIMQVRLQAARTGATIMDSLQVGDTHKYFAARPGGAVVADPALGLDPFTGDRDGEP
jgi:prepilin-type N-terminal cleavage/methylation domain-containing protein